MPKQKTEDSGSQESITLPISIVLNDPPNTGKFKFNNATVVLNDIEQVYKMLKSGFKAELMGNLNEIDKHELFGNFDGKTVKRPESYKRSKVEYSEERADALQQIATGALEKDYGVRVSLTVSRYFATNEVSPEEAELVMAREKIQKRDASGREKLAEAAGYTGQNLTIHNDAFVAAVAVWVRNL